MHWEKCCVKGEEADVAVNWISVKDEPKLACVGLLSLTASGVRDDEGVTHDVFIASVTDDVLA